MADAYGFGRELSGGLYRFLGFVIDDGVVRVYHAGDTIAYDGQAERLRRLGVDVALLPINGRDHFREAAGIVGNLDHREAACLAADARVDVLVPMHYDTFASNRGYPSHLVDFVTREELSVTVLIPTRDRPVLYTKGAGGD
jgi:L-ascorbate metabolism protein UlaG (beta-lactamase superfamily)